MIKHHILKYSKDGEIRKLYDCLLKRAKFNRDLSGSLRKFVPDKSRKHQLPGSIQLERAERSLTFELIRGKTQSGSRGLRHFSGKKIISSLAF